jgi:hypothetical protein
MHDSEFVSGIDEAANVCGVSVTTVYRWLAQNLFTEEEAYRASDKVWIFNRNALLNVRKIKVKKSRGAFRANSLRFHNTPKGYLDVRLSDLPTELLTGYLFELSQGYDENSEVLGDEHKRMMAISSKIQEVFTELTKRGIRLNLSNNPSLFKLLHIEYEKNTA